MKNLEKYLFNKDFIIPFAIVILALVFGIIQLSVGRVGTFLFSMVISFVFMYIGRSETCKKKEPDFIIDIPKRKKSDYMIHLTNVQVYSIADEIWIKKFRGKTTKKVIKKSYLSKTKQLDEIIWISELTEKCKSFKSNPTDKVHFKYYIYEDKSN